MIRLFLPSEKLGSSQIIITGVQARYISLVLRAKPGDALTVFDGCGYRYECRVLHSHKKEVLAEIINKEPYSLESPIQITLVQGIPKSDKMDLIIQKSTELGVMKIVPLITARTQVRNTGRLLRWRKIALSASQQSGREKIPIVDEPINFKVFFEGDKKRHGIIFSEEKKDRNLRKVLKGFEDRKSITLLIGPEGGFSKDEISLAVEKGFVEASLGPRILRTETASIAAIGLIQYELGDMG